MGSVTCVQAAPNSISLCGPLCIMSKKALTPTAALHYKNMNVRFRSINDNVGSMSETRIQCVSSDRY